MTTLTPSSQTGSSQNVFIGGVVGLDDLANPANTAAMTATGRVGFYMQEDAMEAAWSAGTLAAIAQGMAGTGTGEAELNLQSATNIASWFASWWVTAWTNFGLAPTEVNSIINYTSSTWTTDFTAMVDESRKHGISNVAPIFSPNENIYSLNNFATEASYASLRAAALYGGALAIDAPPAYFFQRGAYYQQFTYQEIQWAHQNGLRVTVIISPYNDDANFLHDAQAFVKTLEWNNAVPNEWVVENYTSADPNGIGSDTATNSMAGVALWVAQNAQTNVSSVPLPIPTPTITLAALGTVLEPSVNAGVTVTETVSTTYLAGQIYVGVMTASGNVESSSFWAVNLDANGNGSFSAYLANSGDYILAESTLNIPSVTAASAGVTITEPPASITLGALGSVQEATYGAGVTVTETVGTTNIVGPIYYGVMTAQGNVESSSFSAVSLSAGGTASFSAHLARSGDYILVENSLSSPAVMTKSGAVTITEPPASITPGALGTVQEATYGAGVTVTETVSSTGLTGSLYWGVMTAQGNVESSSFSAVSLSAGGTASFSAHLARSGDYILVENSLSSPAVMTKSGAVTITEPPASITPGALGTVQEATYGAGVTVTETVSSTGLTGSLYWGVMTAQGNVESSSFSAVSLSAGGTASFSAHLARSGDYILVENSLSSPAVMTKSGAVTITEPPASITLGALGTVQEATYGAGVTVTETVSSTGLTGSLYWGVMTAQGNVESSSFSAVSLSAGGTASFSAHLARSGDYILVENSLSSPAVMTKSGAVTITEPPASITPGALGSVQEATYGAGVTVTETVSSTGLTGSLYWGVMTAQGNVESSSFSAVSLSAGGTASFSAHLARSGDYILVENSLSSPAVMTKSGAVTITEPPASITPGALGTVQEATYGAGVTVTETVSSTGLTGSLYWGVMTAQGNVESSSFSAVSLSAGGTASFSAHLARSGDYILVENSLSSPAVMTKSGAVTITEPPASITPGALGTVQEATYGAGVTVTETVSSTGLTGSLYWGVMTAQGNVESSSFSAVSLSAGGTASFSAHLARSGDYILVENSLSSPAVMTKSGAVTITEPPASSAKTAVKGSASPVFIASPVSSKAATQAASMKDALESTKGPKGSGAIDMSANITSIGSAHAVLPAPSYSASSALHLVSRHLEFPIFPTHANPSGLG